MSYPDLPPVVKAMLANEQHRAHHHLWHFVRNRDNWDGLSGEARDELTAAGWKAPRFVRDPGSGIDFLGMHREMIKMTNKALEAAGDPQWPSVRGWNPIPWMEDDPDWPVPEWQISPPQWAEEQLWRDFTNLAKDARSEERVAEMRLLAVAFRDPERLSRITLDALGIAMEWSIHGWMHMRWSGPPYEDGFAVEPENDWLFMPWSSHVNKVFWALHGWIDERIDDWEIANGQNSDLDSAWYGPSHVSGMLHHMTNPRLLELLPSKFERFVSMQIDHQIVDKLLSQDFH